MPISQYRKVIYKHLLDRVFYLTFRCRKAKYLKNETSVSSELQTFRAFEYQKFFRAVITIIINIIIIRNERLFVCLTIESL